jgi:hypothetical protein
MTAELETLVVAGYVTMTRLYVLVRADDDGRMTTSVDAEARDRCLELSPGCDSRTDRDPAVFRSRDRGPSSYTQRRRGL